MAKKQKKARTRLVLFVPICFIVVIAICTTVGNYWIQISEKYHEREVLTNKMLSLREKEAELKAEASRLEDPDYVARYAREIYVFKRWRNYY